MPHNSCDRPLEGLLVVDLSQYLAGPAASLRLADLGAKVIKIEAPGGEGSRRLFLANLAVGGDSVLFQTINRNKLGVEADLKDPEQRHKVMQILKRADVLIHNFRPGVAERLQLDYPRASEVNDRLIYATVSGYGHATAWAHKPGQDLLIQALAGLPWLNGSRQDAPIPVGQPIADMLASSHLVQGILACLLRRSVSGKGGLVEVSLLESLLDLMFETFTTFLNDGGRQPARGPIYSAHAYLSAPYGIYPTSDGFLAVAMAAIPSLGELLAVPELLTYKDPESWFTARDQIVETLSRAFAGNSTGHWLSILEPADVWCAPVLSWPELIQQNAFTQGDFTQTLRLESGAEIATTRCPIRVDGRVFTSDRPAPRLGQHNLEVFDS